jgi:hypothetical protein
MRASVKRFLAKSKFLNQALGDVVFETAEIRGASSHSFFSWRVKKSVEGAQNICISPTKPAAPARWLRNLD